VTAARTYSVAEIHRRYGMEPWKARRWCRTGRWRAKQIGGEWYACAEDVDRTFDLGDRRQPLSAAAKAALDRASGSVA
jgi:hypothetical protein